MTDSYCALLTPRGRGAVAVIAVMGPLAESTLDAQFCPVRRTPLSQLTQRVVYGRWNSTGEDLIIFRRSETSFEIHCHGGATAPQTIIRALVAAGISEITSSAFARLGSNIWQSEIETALSNSTTPRTAELILQQREYFPRAISQIGEMIGSQRLPEAIEKLKSMLAWSEFGRHLTIPRTIVLCGHPNVGKSSLVNAIVGFQRAIVHHVAGTTRDVVSQKTAIAGWPVALKDTAGLREAANAIEAQGVDKAKAQIVAADLILGVFDHSVPWGREDDTFVESIQPDLIVYNKSDLVDESDLVNESELDDKSDRKRPPGIETSAVTREGIEQLIQAIGRRLVPELPSEGQAFSVTPEQICMLKSIQSKLEAGETDEAAALLSVR